jgi:alpha-1,3-fucosyltransferase
VTPERTTSAASVDTPTKAPETTTSTVSVDTKKNAKSDDSTKYILYYNHYWFKDDFQFGVGRQPFLDYQCPVNNCFAQPHHPTTISTNKSQYDAVLVSAQADDFRFSNHIDDIQTWRQPNQRFVFFIMESQAWPIYSLREMNSFFNWTMTFKWNSDIPRPYGWFQKRIVAPPEAYEYASKPKKWIQYDEANFRSSLPSRDDSFRALARRPGKVAWIVSHCGTESLREDYVSQLRRYIQVDEFGGCQRGAPTCDLPYTITGVDNCTKHVQENYKFYLAFENIFCNDYATEKFFRRMNDAVVITLGQANYSEIAPPHSFIDIFDFDSAKTLANYIHELDQDDGEYLSYFWWKDHYQVQHPYTGISGSKMNNFGRSMCHLCEKLHDDTEPNKVYDNMYQWWRGDAQCGKRLPGLRARMAQNPSLPGIRKEQKIQFRQHLLQPPH